MSEKTPEFVVTDRRKFTLDGDLREEDAARDQEQPPRTADEAAQPKAEETASARVVSMPRRDDMPELLPEQAPEPSVSESSAADEAEDPEELARPLTEEETAEQHAAYRQSSQQLDELLKQSNPGMQSTGPVTFEHVIQSIYLSAMIAMGAGTEPGQQPRIDILGARQSVDMLGVLQDKTKGNLTEREAQMLQNAVFELRMMFLEITNAIAKQAQNPPPKGRK